MSNVELITAAKAKSICHITNLEKVSPDIISLLNNKIMEMAKEGSVGTIVFGYVVYEKHEEEDELGKMNNLARVLTDLGYNEIHVGCCEDEASNKPYYWISFRF